MKGITEINFYVGKDNNKSKLKIIEVGGQKNERKKWIHCFDNVTAVIFVVAVSDYSCSLDDDNTSTSLSESYRLFQQTINSIFFIFIFIFIYYFYFYFYLLFIISIFIFIFIFLFLFLFPFFFCLGHWFKNTSVVLLLNKKDLFQKKIQKISLTQTFPVK